MSFRGSHWLVATGTPIPFGKRVTLYRGIPDFWKIFTNNLLTESYSLGDMCAQVRAVAVTNTTIPKLTVIFESKNRSFQDFCHRQREVAEWFLYYTGYESVTIQIIAAIDGGKKSAG